MLKLHLALLKSLLSPFRMEENWPNETDRAIGTPDHIYSEPITFPIIFIILQDRYYRPFKIGGKNRVTMERATAKKRPNGWAY